MQFQDIKPYPLNAKKHPAKQVELIAQSLRDFGWQQPIKAGKDGFIIVGHGRRLAYESYGEKYGIAIPWVINEEGVTVMGCAEPKKLTETEEKAYRIIDNKIAESEWELDLVIPELKLLQDSGFDINKTGFDPSVLTIKDSFNLPDGDKPPLEQITFTLSREQAELIKEAVLAMKNTEEFKLMEKTSNENSNGNALALIIMQWGEQKKSE